jgi:hypothetical protein
MVVEGAQAIALVLLSRGGNHDLLAPWAPPGAQGGQPTDVACVSIREHLASFQVVAGFFTRLFLAQIPGPDCCCDAGAG